MRVVESLHLDEVVVGVSVEGVVNAVLLAVFWFGFNHDPGGDHALVECVDVVGDDCDDHPITVDPIRSQTDAQEGGVRHSIDVAIALIEHQLESKSIAVETRACLQVGCKQEGDECFGVSHQVSVEVAGSVSEQWFPSW